MSLKRIDFKKEHMEYLLKQQPNYDGYVTPEMMQHMEDAKETYTAVREDGEIILCGGIRNLWPGRGELWAFFCLKPGSYSLALHKMILDLIKKANLKRLEMVVYYENTMGHKLAKTLGFRLETERLVAYRPDGGDVSMYVIINGEN